AYLQEYVARYDELLALFNQIPSILTANYKQLEATGALAREQARWPQILNEYSPEDKQTQPSDYKAHVRHLSDWIMSRTAWCYMELGGDDRGKAARMKQTKPVIRVMDPDALANANPFYVKVMDGFSYIWNDSPTANTTGQKRITATGKYWVKLKDSAGNISLASDTLYVGMEPPIETALNPLSTNDFFFCNNPVDGTLHICYSVDRVSPVKIQIFNLNGLKQMEVSTQAQAGYNRQEISLNGLINGAYLLRVFTEKKLMVKKLIIDKL
ncbi:MAG: T9SS type A sorting domain-containing protein, partial [Dysgonamonadaceae bacterium]|nr:T9SS type A sorting domain-containing protein [Dysgonamonadaceae bacterium]